MNRLEYELEQLQLILTLTKNMQTQEKIKEKMMEITREIEQ